MTDANACYSASGLALNKASRFWCYWLQVLLRCKNSRRGEGCGANSAQGSVSLRDIEELLFERGVVVSYETIRRWCDEFGAGFAHRVKAARRKPGRTWNLDEVFVTLRGVPYLLWRAVDQHGAELDILLQKHRDKAAAKRFFNRVLAACADAPRRIVTDQLRSYPAAKAEIPELANVKHVFVKASARVNNRAENSHQPTRERERRMRGFRLP
uniref:IS6 family transposase n=1 Tax=Paraburkholderia atlantica TaxID=2654982 RepID=UPI002AAFC6B4